jgi:hypothetical protein
VAGKVHTRTSGKPVHLTASGTGGGPQVSIFDSGKLLGSNALTPAALNSFFVLLVLSTGEPGKSGKF